MQNNRNQAIKIAFIIGITVFAVLAVSSVPQYFSNQRLGELESHTQQLIADQQTTLTTIAEITARNGADAVTEEIIQDCTVSDRDTFDTLLNDLNNGLSQSQLTELERLFGRCGGFFSERKSVMVARLTREFEVYETYVQQLGIIEGKEQGAAFNIDQWRELVQAEQKQSQLFSELVDKQDKIISTLLAGKSAQSAEIKEILQSVSDIQGTLEVTSQQGAKIRAELTSL